MYIYQLIQFVDQGAQSDSAIDLLQTDTEEECSFLKIENVISLAPRADNNESLIVCACLTIIFYLIC